MIRTREVDGVQTLTHDEGTWLFERVGQWAAWTATHTPTGIAFDTKLTDLDDVRRAVHELVPDLYPTPAEPVGVRYTVARGRQSAARPGVAREGETNG